MTVIHCVLSINSNMDSVREATEVTSEVAGDKVVFISKKMYKVHMTTRILRNLLHPTTCLVDTGTSPNLNNEAY